jgi:aminopeptidase-like protein
MSATVDPGTRLAQQPDATDALMPASSMMDILAALTPLNRAVCSAGYDQAVAALCDVLPFRVIGIPESFHHNGWVIPPSWDVDEAWIARDGRVIYDATRHPLQVIALSAPFSGMVPLEELRRHLHYDHRDETSIPFHYRQQFRSWQRDWGFCVPKQVYDELTPGNYEVMIRTRERAGELKILEYTHQGATDTTIVIGGNLDHAGVANDGLAGCVVGLEALRRLRGRKTKFSYALVLSPGILGSELYLATRSEAERSHLLEGVFLEMLGSRTPLALQEPRRPMAAMPHALRLSLEGRGLSYRAGAFGSILVNDEYIWENYDIPMSSLSRFPYPEYHSSHDSMEIIREASLEEAVDVLVGAIDHLERSPFLVKRFNGNLCLSNPQYDLYVDYGQVALGDEITDRRLRLRQLMDLIPSLDRPVSVRALADHVGLPEQDALEYLRRWQEKGLLDLL